MKKTNEEKGQRMFSLILPIEDFKLLEVIKKKMRFTTNQQAVKYLLYNSACLQDFEKITLNK